MREEAPDSGRRLPLCREPWESYYILRRGILPCCHGHGAIAEMADWQEAWNSEPMQEIREHLARGELSPYCRKSLACPIVQRVMAEEGGSHESPEHRKSLWQRLKRWAGRLKVVILPALLLAAAGSSHHCRSVPEDPPRPRPSAVLLVTIDTLRADHLGLYHYGRKTSPFLDELAVRSTVFNDVSAQIPKTLPSVASMMTSRFPEEIGLLSNRNVLGPDTATLARLLQREGYRTIAYTSNGNLIEKRGIAAGFDEFTFEPCEADWLTTAVLRRFEAPLSEPYFIWVHYNDPHGKYTPPRRFDEMFVGDPLYDAAREATLDYEPLPGYNRNFVLGAIPRYQQQPYLEHPRRQELDFYVAQYDAEIRGTDAQLRRLVNTLERTGRLENVLLVVTADHGEGLGEHDFWFEHGWFAYRGQLQVPLLIRRPGQTGQRVVEQPVSLIDLAPTILDLLGIARPAEFRGQSLVPLIDGGTIEPQAVYAVTPDVYPRQYRSLRQGRWKYIVDDQGREELYDLEADPNESVNLVRQSPESLGLLREMMASGVWAAEGVGRKTLPDGVLEDDVTDQLRALGYLDQ